MDLLNKLFIKTKKNTTRKINKSLKKHKLNYGKKTYEDLDSEEKKILNIISVLDGKTMPVGSFLFKEHKYPGDIDMTETIYECCEEKEVKLKIVNRILDTIKVIVLSNPKVFLGDFKAGEDKRFDFKLNKSNQKEIKEKIINLENIINKKDFSELITILNAKNININQMKIVNDIIHNYKIIRWNIKELLNKKKNKNKRIIKLEDAISDGSVVKMDVWFNMKGKFIEITNFLNICLSDKKEEKCIKSLSLPMINLVKTLKEDIEKYYEKKDYLKMMKRVWSLMKYILIIPYNKNIKKTALKIKLLLTPLFKSKSAQISQIYAELEVLELMAQKFINMKNYHLFPSNEVLIEILQQKNRIKTIIPSKSYGKDVHNQIDKILSEIDKIKSTPENISKDKYWNIRNNKMFMNIILSEIPKLMNYLNQIKSIETDKWMKENNISPTVILEKIKKI